MQAGWPFWIRTGATFAYPTPRALRPAFCGRWEVEGQGAFLPRLGSSIASASKQADNSYGPFQKSAVRIQCGASDQCQCGRAGRWVEPLIDGRQRELQVG